MNILITYFLWNLNFINIELFSIYSYELISIKRLKVLGRMSLYFLQERSFWSMIFWFCYIKSSIYNFSPNMINFDNPINWYVRKKLPSWKKNVHDNVYQIQIVYKSFFSVMMLIKPLQSAFRAFNSEGNFIFFLKKLFFSNLK